MRCIRMDVEIITNIGQINNRLNSFWGNKRKITKPFLRPILILAYTKENSPVGFLYCYDLNDGYFREIILDDLFIKRQFHGGKYDSLLINAIIKYAKEHSIERLVLYIKEDNSRLKDMLKVAGFRINTNISMAELTLPN